ncbi:uncharacterized protein LOC110889418 isoform X2 [Helianthus annuus]|uniref:uncharacterized protein LOC110889418 isoform X2 n=1 Tax=Helianthus annuus TaxID=4232 RepID=UPI000B8FE791|nr:uncharacterized protein LOC110889418 isoform X2 [Helianthus annuus]
MAVSHSPNSKSKKKAADTNPQPHKRNSNPVVRLIHGRIYDSHNGSTCHQCRHKTYAAYVNCKNQAKTKPCPIKYCGTCLLNRYGEKVEDVSLLDKWDCPKCKGVCNCSICMKKCGQQPTGIATRMAKASGFSSVSDLIVAKGAQNVSNYKKPGKENLFDGKTRLNTNPPVSVSSTVNEKPKKTKRKGSEVNDVSVTETNHTPNKKQKKLKSKGSNASVRGDVFTNLLSKVNGGQQPENVVKERLDDNQCLKVEKKALDLFEVVIPLVTGNELVNIAGVDLPKEDAGNALQLLEFIATFGKILDVKKGQAEAVLRDLIKGRSTRRGKFTSVSQFHIQLLSVIQEKPESESESESESSDMTQGNDSWLKDLKTCIAKSKSKDVDFIDMLAGGYDDLDSSTKLRLLVFLCDEVLGTEKIRNWIDEQNAMFSEKRKEAKDKLSVAKDKEKSLKQKMQDDIAKAITAKEGVPLTIKEHDAIVSKIKDKAAEAHAEILASEKLVPLDIGSGDHTVEAADKWFEYDDEQMDLIEKHINVMRSRFRKYYKN